MDARPDVRPVRLLVFHQQAVKSSFRSADAAASEVIVHLPLVIFRMKARAARLRIRIRVEYDGRGLHEENSSPGVPTDHGQFAEPLIEHSSRRREAPRGRKSYGSRMPSRSEHPLPRYSFDQTAKSFGNPVVEVPRRSFRRMVEQDVLAQTAIRSRSSSG